MAEIEFSGKRKSVTTAFSLSPNMVAKLESYSKMEKYGSKSSIAQQALSEFFAREDARRQDRTGKVIQ